MTRRWWIWQCVLVVLGVSNIWLAIEQDARWNLLAAGWALGIAAAEFAVVPIRRSLERHRQMLREEQERYRVLVETLNALNRLEQKVREGRLAGRGPR